jgi:hypothetical protein
LTLVDSSGTIPSRSYLSSYWDWNSNTIYLIGGKGASSDLNDVWRVANLPSTAPPSRAPTNSPITQVPTIFSSPKPSLLPTLSPTMLPTKQNQIGLSQVTTSGASFTARSGATLAYVFNSNYILIFGGQNNVGYLSDVWKLDSSSKL